MEETRVSSSTCSRVFHAKHGLRFNITLINFMGTVPVAAAAGDRSREMDTGGQSHGHQRMDVCLEVATVFDLGVNRRHVVTICGGDGRRIHVMTSESNRIKIDWTNQRMTHSDDSFLEYQVIGCSDPPPFADGWMRRSGDAILMGCNSSLVSWQLTCKSGQWQGDQRNCSPSKGQSASLVPPPPLPLLPSELARLTPRERELRSGKLAIHRPNLARMPPCVEL